MGQPLSMDLRARLIAAIDDGMSCRAAAARFGVAPSTAIRWHAQRRDVGHFKPKAQGGDMRSHHVEKRATDILALWEGECAIFCVSVIWSMLPERSKDDDDFERTAGRTAEGLQAA